MEDYYKENQPKFLCMDYDKYLYSIKFTAKYKWIGPSNMLNSEAKSNNCDTDENKSITLKWDIETDILHNHPLPDNFSGSDDLLDIAYAEPEQHDSINDAKIRECIGPERSYGRKLCLETEHVYVLDNRQDKSDTTKEIN